MMEMSTEYRQGYDEGYERAIRDFEERLKKYYSAFTGKTLTATVEYTIKIMADELIEARE
jgi:hypothetical protein